MCWIITPSVTVSHLSKFLVSLTAKPSDDDIYIAVLLLRLFREKKNPISFIINFVWHQWTVLGEGSQKREGRGDKGVKFKS